MKVQIVKLNELIGTIPFDGKRIVCDPPDNRLLRSIATTAVATRQSGTMRRILPQEGDNFIKALPWQYRSAYLRAVEVASTREGDPTNPACSRSLKTPE